MSNTNRGKDFEAVVKEGIEKTGTYVLRLYDPQGGYASVANPCDFIAFRNHKMFMIECDLFDKTGMVVTATFADASTENVTASCTWSPDGALSTSDTEVTISYTYKGVNKTATQAITVKAYVQPTSVSVTNWNTLFGTSFTGSLSGTDLKTYSGITNRVTIEYAKGSGNNMYMKNTEIRLYSGNTLSFTAPTGYCIKQIEFSGTIDDGKKPTVDVGTYNNSTKKWTGAATTVIFTGTATSANISSVTITLSTTVPVTIASSCYSTLATSCGLDFANATPSGLEAYVVPSVTASAVSLSAVNEAPASTGVILKGTASTEYTIPVKVGAASVGTNKLHAAEKATTLADGSFYILKSGLFCLVTGAADAAARTVPAGKAYLLKSDVPASAPGYLGFDFGSTNISTTNFTNDTNNSGEFYNLAGQRVANPTKGLYIVNGRKVVIK